MTSILHYYIVGVVFGVGCIMVVVLLMNQNMYNFGYI